MADIDMIKQSRIQDLQIVGGVTSLLDALLLWVWYDQFEMLCFYDKCFLGIVMSSHILFYYGLYYDQDDILDPLHIVLFLCLFGSIGLENKILIGLCLFLSVLIQLLWIHQGRCILNRIEDANTFGYSEWLWTSILLLSLWLVHRISGTNGSSSC